MHVNRQCRLAAVSEWRKSVVACMSMQFFAALVHVGLNRQVIEATRSHPRRTVV
jgi:hypothetical protein